jgi:hypothetical protein
MVSIKEINRDDKILFLVDYSNCKEAEMLSGEAEVKVKILQINKPILLISVFNEKGYITPRFMRVAERDNIELAHLIDKQAVVGLNLVKKMILKGFNILLRRNIRNFDSIDEAVQFLFDPNSTDKDFQE